MKLVLAVPEAHLCPTVTQFHACFWLNEAKRSNGLASKRLMLLASQQLKPPSSQITSSVVGRTMRPIKPINSLAMIFFAGLIVKGYLWKLSFMTIRVSHIS